MAEISTYPFIRHLRADATTYVRHLAKGEVQRTGTGLSFWFRPGTAAISEVPMDDREQPLLFHARTADFQDVTVQATVSYRIVDPDLAATRIDFGIAPRTGVWNASPLDALAGLLSELAQQPALEQVAATTMTEALAHGTPVLRQAVAEALADDPRLDERGLVVTDVRVVAIRAEAELERALQADAREHIQQEADRATYERRARAVEQERAIAENELQNQIELARRQEELVVQEGANARRRAGEKAAADRIAAEAEADELRLRAQSEAAATEVRGEAEAAAEAARLGAYVDLDHGLLLALAAKELAGNLPDVHNLTITPDLVTGLLQQLAAPAAALDEVG